MVTRVIATLAALGAFAVGPASHAEPARPAGAPASGPSAATAEPSAALAPAATQPGKAISTAAQPKAPESVLALPATIAPVTGATLKVKPPPLEPVKLSDDPRPTLRPDTFTATMNAAERYRTIAEAGGWSTVPAEAIRLKPGARGPAVAVLRRRLAATDDLSESERGGDLFDDGLAAGLKRFQLRHGLEETGIVGPRTLVHLNVSAAARVNALQASAGRLMGSRFPFGDRYVAVNIPSAAVEAIDHGRVARRFVAIVGKPDRASPQVETRVTSVNFNPTWTVPVSLIRKDIIPHVRKDPNYLARLKIRLFDASGTEVDPGTVDWSTERAVNYTIRQDAGIDNSLGEVRIDMPNRHSVYMHDTPSKRLFARTMRAQSSGCVRVSGVKDLVGWLLEGTTGPAGASSTWGQPEIDAAITSGRRQDARLARPIPVAWVYLTGYATADGMVHFRDDIYGLDEAAASPAGPSATPPVTIESLVTSSIAPTAR